jgi:hypothetical protein
VIRIWVKAHINRIQVSRNNEFHSAFFTDDGTVYGYCGNAMLLQACLELWQPPNNKFIITEEQLSQSEWMA